jgi:fatty acid desaturase
LHNPDRALTAEATALVRDLHRVSPLVYWSDLAISVLIGWGAFAAALRLPLPLDAPAVIGAGIVAVLALYRALCFIHEISHQSSRTLPGFEFAWNLLAGFPLLFPSCLYVGVHSAHHRLSTYGTTGDPEYLPFARSFRLTVLFALQSVLIPCALAVRFFLLGPIAVFVPKFERFLVAHFSSLSMNVRYRREITPKVVRAVRLHNAGILIVWASLAVLPLRAPVISIRFCVTWYVVSAAISLINSLRTLGAHAYLSGGEPLAREEQLLDSIDTPALWFGALWAPVGLRFHALHHYFPGIPYHNLGTAWRRLSSLPDRAEIHRVRSRSLIHSLTVLCRRALSSPQPGRHEPNS